jgi:DNA-binding MarR family transcriptional regulator
VHGWAIVRLLQPSGELGRIWSLTRPLTYRSLDRIVDLGLVTRTQTGRRADLTVTPNGRQVALEWLEQPVEHVRQVRTEFLLKLALLSRAGLPIDVLVLAQRATLASALEALTALSPVGDDDPVAVWRRHSAGATRDFLDDLARSVG